MNGAISRTTLDKRHPGHRGRLGHGTGKLFSLDKREHILNHGSSVRSRFRSTRAASPRDEIGRQPDGLLTRGLIDRLAPHTDPRGRLIGPTPNGTALIPNATAGISWPDALDARPGRGS